VSSDLVGFHLVGRLNMLKKYFRTSVTAVIIASLLSVSVVPQAQADGVTWTSRTAAAAAGNQWTSVAYGNGLFVAVSWTGTSDRVMSRWNHLDQSHSRCK